MQIENLEAAGPYVHLDDETMGTYQVERMRDAASGAEYSSRFVFSEASGKVGEAARQLEDSEHEFQKVLSERMPDVANDPNSTIYEKALALRVDPKDAPLRVRDSLAKLQAAQDRVDGLVGEVARRKADRDRTEHLSNKATELALAKAAALDERERKSVTANDSLSNEEKAVELARLQVPLNERKGKARETWKQLLREAADHMRDESYRTRLQQRLKQSLIDAGDPLLRYLRDGERMDLDTYKGTDDRRGYEARSPAEAAALRALRGVEGLVEPKREEIPMNAQEEFNQRIAESMAYSKQKHEEHIKALMGGEKR